MIKFEIVLESVFHDPIVFGVHCKLQTHSNSGILSFVENENCYLKLFSIKIL